MSLSTLSKFSLAGLLTTSALSLQAFADAADAPLNSLPSQSAPAEPTLEQTEATAAQEASDADKAQSLGPVSASLAPDPKTDIIAQLQANPALATDADKAPVDFISNASPNSQPTQYAKSAGVDFHARLMLPLGVTRLYNYDQEYRKNSYIAISPWKRVGNARFGITYVPGWTGDLANDDFKFTNRRLYVYAQAPALGLATVGKNTGVLEDFVLKSQYFKTTQTFHYPFVGRLEHPLTWKFASTDQRYYTYNLSLSGLDKRVYKDGRPTITATRSPYQRSQHELLTGEYQDYFQATANLNYVLFQRTDPHISLQLSFLASYLASTRPVEAENLRLYAEPQAQFAKNQRIRYYRTYPLAAALSLESPWLDVGFTALYAKENMRLVKTSLQADASITHVGYLGYAAVKVGTFSVYGRYVVFDKRNEGEGYFDQAGSFLEKQTLNRRLETTIGAGWNMNNHAYFYAEYSAQARKQYAEQDRSGFTGDAVIGLTFSW